MPNDVFLQIYQDNFLLGRPVCTVDEKLAATLSVLDSLSLKVFRIGSLVGTKDGIIGCSSCKVMILLIFSRMHKRLKR